jgi:hypothetical protein
MYLKDCPAICHHKTTFKDDILVWLFGSPTEIWTMSFSNASLILPLRKIPSSLIQKSRLWVTLNKISSGPTTSSRKDYVLLRVVENKCPGLMCISPSQLKYLHRTKVCGFLMLISSDSFSVECFNCRSENIIILHLQVRIPAIVFNSPSQGNLILP